MVDQGGGSDVGVGLGFGKVKDGDSSRISRSVLRQMQNPNLGWVYVEIGVSGNQIGMHLKLPLLSPLLSSHLNQTKGGERNMSVS